MHGSIVYKIVDHSLDRDKCEGSPKVYNEITKLLRLAKIEYDTISRAYHIERTNYYDGFVDLGHIYKSTITVAVKDLDDAQELVKKAQKKIRIRSKHFPSPPNSPNYLSSTPLQLF